MRYTLHELYDDVSELFTDLKTYIRSAIIYPNTLANDDVTLLYISNVVYNEFYDDEIAYEGDDFADTKSIFLKRISYEISIKYNYWKKKYEYVNKLLTENEISLLQSSKMVSSSKGRITNAGGTMQKSASTPTGVSTTNNGDDLQVSTKDAHVTGSSYDMTYSSSVTSTSFVDKYTNFQGKTNSSSVADEDRNATIFREVSIEELLRVLEKLPASFGDEVTKYLAHNFMFVYSY